MTRHWRTGKPITDAKHTWQDLILEDEIGISHEDWQKTVGRTVVDISQWTCEIEARVNQLQEYLSPSLERQNTDFRRLPSLVLPSATIADQALICSAIAYCLAYDNGYAADQEATARLRLSALTIGWPGEILEAYHAVWDGVASQPIEPDPDGGVLERILAMALTASSKRMSFIDSEWQQTQSSAPDDISSIRSAGDFNAHPLSQVELPNTAQVGLLLGGATKIKGYFVESAKLPEIRGASALLDRINLEDVPALFGRKIKDQNRYIRLRNQFTNRTGHTIKAPECIVYAAGGSTLAFAPTSLVHELAEEIEHTYTRETLVANSVAVGETFNLLELQYGLQPNEFWLEEFRHASQTDATAVLTTYYGGTDDQDFFKKKCFGELTSRLASAQLRRREGNHTPDRTTQRDLPAFVEASPYVRLCASCDRRPVTVFNLNADKYLCEACARKYVTGRVTKKPAADNPVDTYLNCLNGWEPASKVGEEYLIQDWISRFKKHQRLEDEFDGPQDLADIAQASNPSGFIALIYADGNNMGGYLEKVSTPAQYRQFSERVFVALQKAVYDAFAEHLKPVDQIYPFEIISIGGDDLLLIVPADKVFDIVHDIGQNFDGAFSSAHKYVESQGHPHPLGHSQRYCSEKWLKRSDQQLPAISLSLGFVIADEHTPFAFLEQLADGLLKSAKEGAKTLEKQTGYTGGTVDFLALKSLSMVSSDIGEYRDALRKEFRSGRTKTQYSLTMHPFTLHELQGLVETVQVLKEVGFPPNQLYQLRESLGKGLGTSTVDYLYFRSRLTNRTHFEKLGQTLERDWLGCRQDKSLPPWYARLTGGHETLLLDLLEIYDFVREPDSEGGNNDN